MGKKTKIGKSRKDKFYQLAKETGYRARSAFKLIQLNRKYEFLQKSQVVIDLCAAPGGWLQVVAENAPVSSVIIGVDLVKIKPLPNVVTLQEDITTEKCRQSLKKELQTWKADCVIHDGAPNVGQNWIQDAFKQAELTLVALKLATEFLKSGGWFVTKVFRSKDYNALLWVFQQLFKHVYATKPQASRTESAEIFVVCQGYLAPHRIDPKFLDPRHVFKEVEPETRQLLDLIHPEKHRRHRTGYADGDYTLYHEVTATDFLEKENHLELLAASSAIVLNDERIANHPLTTTEIKECLKDIKVLGKKELQSLIKWRTQLKKFLKPDQDVKKDDEKTTEDLESDDDDLKLEEKLAELKEEERKNLKKKLKKVRKERTKLRHKMDVKMILPDDKPDLVDDLDLFNLKKIKSKKQLLEMEKGAMAVIREDDSEPETPHRVAVYDKDTKDYLDPNEGSMSEDSGEEEPEFEEETDDDSISNDINARSDDSESEDEKGSNPLLVSLEDRNLKKQKKLNMWYSKDSFAGLEDEKDEFMEIQQMVNDSKKKDKTDKKNVTKSKARGEKSKVTTNKSHDEKDGDSGTFSESDQSSEESETESESDSDYDEREFLQSGQNLDSDGQPKESKAKNKKTDFEVVPESRPDLRLNPTGLTIGAAMVSSRKRRREIIEEGYHRYTFDDDNLPEWFRKDEIKHSKRQLPVTKGDVEEYRMKMKAIDAQPIKKIAEAKSRKKKKSLRKLERVRKKAEAISDTVDISEKEKWQQIKQMYKKAGLLSKKKEDVAYIVAKKGIGKRVRRPQGVQGPFKVVDPRMKKDSRKMKALAKKTKKRTEKTQSR